MKFLRDCFLAAFIPLSIAMAFVVFVPATHADTVAVVGSMSPLIGATGFPLNGDGDPSCAFASPFVPSADFTLDSVDSLYANSSGGDSVTVRVFDDSSGSPGTSLEQGTDITPTSAYPTGTLKTSTFAGTTALTNGTTYWAVFSRSASCTSNTGGYWVAGDSGGPGLVHSADHDGSWISGSDSVSFTVYGTPSGGGGGGGGGGGSGDSPTAATSTLNQSEQNLGTAVYIYLISFLGVVWLFRKRN